MNDHNTSAEINRLHEEVIEKTDTSKKCLHAALVAAWKAGRLLTVERKRVRDTMGGVWGEWLKQNFRGSRVTAQKYIRLAEVVCNESQLEGLSLRQMYLRLGIATEPKTRAESGPVASFPPHVRLANKLLAVLRPPNDFHNSSSYAAYRQDLRTLYLRLRAHFESEWDANKIPLEIPLPSQKITP